MSSPVITARPGPRRLLGMALAVLLVALPAQSQPASSPDPSHAPPAPKAPPRIGLALSGGAARGLAHIGVLKVLEEEGLAVDVVAGTSMGALVGGLYAMGYTAAQLETIVQEIDMAAVFTGETNRSALRLEQRRLPSETVLTLPVDGTSVQLPSGLRSGQTALMTLSRLTWPVHHVEDLTALPRPFAAVSVDLRAGQAVALTDGYLTDALYASMSLPSALLPAHRDGRLFVDGGLARNLPTTDALALGADLVIASDVTGLMQDGNLTPVGPEGNASALDILLEAATIGTRAGIRDQRNQAAVLIEPTLDGLGSLAFEQAAAFIARGEAAARAQLPAIRALVDSLGGPVPPPTDLPVPSPVRVGQIRVTGVPPGSAAEALVRTRLDLDLPRLLHPAEAEAAAERVHGTGLFDQVSYRVLPGPDGQPGELVIRVRPQTVTDRLGVGFRYDEFYGPGLLLSLALKNRLRFGDTAAITARLGSQFEISGSYFTRLGTDSPVTVGAELGYANAPYDAYDERELDAEVDPTRYRQRVLGASAFGGLALSEGALIGLRTRAERQSTVTLEVPSAEEEFFTVSSPYADRVEAATGRPFDGETIPFIVGFDGAAFSSTVLSVGLFTEVDTRDRIVYPRKGVRLQAEAMIGQANLQQDDLRAAYQHAFLDAYDRFDVPDVLVAEAPDPDAARDRLANETRSELEREVTEEARRAFPDRTFAPYTRFVVDVEAALPVGAVTVFGRAAYSQGDGDGLPASAYTAVGGIHASAVYAESFFPLVGLRPQQLVGTRGYLGVLGLQAEVWDVVVRGFVNGGDAFGEEDRLVDTDDDNDFDEDDLTDDDEDDEDIDGLDLARAVIGAGLEVGIRTPLGPASLIIGTTGIDAPLRVGINIGFDF